MLPEYGLSDLDAGGEHAADALNDDTFGGSGTEWQQNNAKLQAMHEEFLADRAGDGPGGGGGFFGNALQDSSHDFLLETEPMPDEEDEALGEDDADADAGDAAAAAAEPQLDLALDAQTEQMLDDFDSPAKPAPPPAAPAYALRVSGLPPSLDEAQTRMLFSHFGQLSRFERRPDLGAAMVMYHSAAATQTALASLQEIPLGGRCAPSPPPAHAPPSALTSDAPHPQHAQGGARRSQRARAGGARAAAAARAARAARAAAAAPAAGGPRPDRWRAQPRRR